VKVDIISLVAYKITIVEDDEQIRNLYKAKLTLSGYNVSTSSDGLQALSVIESQNPDLILLDIKMPKLPGQEVLRRIRLTEKGEKIKVIVLTNISKNEAPHEFRFLHIDRYIVKVHYTPSQVVEIIKSVLDS
jgi:DNA-binding response OmpR family regulator